MVEIKAQTDMILEAFPEGYENVPTLEGPKQIAEIINVIADEDLAPSPSKKEGEGQTRGISFLQESSLSLKKSDNDKKER